jgi:transcriptional regulator with XRE-family HTH domain
MREIAGILKELRPSKGSQLAVAKALGITSQQLGSYERGDYKPKADFFDKWKEVFGEDLRQIQKGNIQRNVSHGTENITPAIKSTSNTEKMKSRDEMYQDLVEANSDYRLVPKVILEKYHIIPKEEAEERREILKQISKTKDDLISEKVNRIDELTVDRDRLRVLVTKFQDEIANLEKTVEQKKLESESLRSQLAAKVAQNNV